MGQLLEASGTRGRIVIMWDRRVWEGEISRVAPIQCVVGFLGSPGKITI